MPIDPANPTAATEMYRVMTQPDLDLGVVGNGSFGALVDKHARVVWSCLPTFDGDPTFCALLGPNQQTGGDFAIELEDFAGSEQEYLTNTAILRTVLRDAHGGELEILDFAPRWRQNDRFYRPVSLIRQVRPLAGSPRITVRARPLADWGARVPESTWGSNHVRWILPEHVLRLTTDVPVRFVRDGLPFVLNHPIHLILGVDESLNRSISGYVQEAFQRTRDYWREWVRYLSIPLEWQDAVIRSAITLKLCQYEDSGAIIAAMTTSIPEAPGSVRNWDYRYCWLRDAAFVVRALNRLGATRTMEQFLGYIFNLATTDGTLQPLYGIGFEAKLDEDEVPSLSGYRGMGPVRRGNLAWVQRQHDVYGSVVLASTQLFFDRRLQDPGDAHTFARLEPLGERAFALHDVPDAGLWSSGAAPRCTPTPARCAGPPATACARSPCASSAMTVRTTGASAPTPSMRASWPNPGMRNWATSPIPSAAIAWTPRSCCWPTSASSMRWTPASSLPSMRSAATSSMAIRCTAMSRRMTSASRRPASPSARSGTSMRWRRSGAWTRRARCSSCC